MPDTGLGPKTKAPSRNVQYAQSFQIPWARKKSSCTTVAGLGGRVSVGCGDVSATVAIGAAIGVFVGGGRVGGSVGLAGVVNVAGDGPADEQAIAVATRRPGIQNAGLAVMLFSFNEGQRTRASRRMAPAAVPRDRNGPLCGLPGRRSRALWGGGQSKSAYCVNTFSAAVASSALPGIMKQTRLPVPSLLSHQICPRCISTIALAIERPNPIPP